MAGGYCCKRASVSAMNKLLPIAFIKAYLTTDIMNPLSRLNNAAPPILSGLLLACLPLAHIAQAVDSPRSLAGRLRSW